MPRRNRIEDRLMIEARRKRFPARRFDEVELNLPYGPEECHLEGRFGHR